MKKDFFKNNPAVKSMLTIALYLVLIIGMWSVIGSLAFPDASKPLDVKIQKAVADNEPLLAQLAEAAADDELIEALQATDTVQELLKELHVTGIQPTENGAEFAIEIAEDSAGHDFRLLYFKEGGYVFATEDPDAWMAVNSGKSGTLRWENGQSFVEVTRLTERFFWEETFSQE